MQSGVYLIRGQGENLLIDTGNWTFRNMPTAWGISWSLFSTKRKTRLKYIVITHFHYDHAGNAALLKKRYGAQVVAHPLDKPIIEDPMIVTTAGQSHTFRNNA